MKKGDPVQFRVATIEVSIWGTGTIDKIRTDLLTIELKLETFNWEPVKLSYRQEFLLADRIVYKTTRTNQGFVDVKPAQCWAIGDPSREDLEITARPLQRFMVANIYSTPSNSLAYESLARVEQNATGMKFEEVLYDCPKCGQCQVGKYWGGVLYAACGDCRINVSCCYPLRKPISQRVK